MPKRQESRKTKRTRAARERAREAHAKLVVERQGDPRYVQQTRTETGRTLQLRPDDVTALRRQRELFVEKFGREPAAEDPLFFDPDADVPTPMNPNRMYEAARDAAVRAGLNTADIDAWQEVGYIVTEENRHLFSAHETEAYEDAVERARVNEQ